MIFLLAEIPWKSKTDPCEPPSCFSTIVVSSRQRLFTCGVRQFGLRCVSQTTVVPGLSEGTIMKTLVTTASVFVITAVAIGSFITPTVFGKEQDTTKANPASAESVTARVDKLFAEWNRSDSPGCSLGVSQNGVPLYQHGYGMATLESGAPLPPPPAFPPPSA